MKGAEAATKLLPHRCDSKSDEKILVKERNEEMKATKGEAGLYSGAKKTTDIESGTGIWNCHRAFDTWYLADAYKTESFDSCRRTWMLPAAKALVEVITISPYHSIAEERAKEIQKHAEDLTVAFDLVFTSKDKFMPVDSIIILDNTNLWVFFREKK